MKVTFINSIKKKKNSFQTPPKIFNLSNNNNNKILERITQTYHLFVLKQALRLEMFISPMKTGPTGTHPLTGRDSPFKRGMGRKIFVHKDVLHPCPISLLYFFIIII